MTTETMERPVLDLNQLSEADLLKALEQKRQAKTQDREAYKKLVEETVPKAVERLLYISELLADAKAQTFDFFREIMQLKASIYGIKEKQQSHTFSNDKYSITIGYRVNDGWDDTVSAGIQKVNNFIQSLATDDQTAALVDTVFNLLKKDAKGNLKANRVLELQKLTPKFNNAEFTDGVNIIVDAYKPIRSSWFIEAEVLNDNGTKEGIPLSMSSVGFPVEFKFDFFNDVKSEIDAAAE
jgi:hypothetical protein